MNGRRSGVLAGFAAFILLLGSLLGGVLYLTSTYSFYEYEYSKYDAASDIGVDHAGLMDITHTVLDYLGGKRDNMDMQAVINGENQEVFTQREKDHMIDVANLVRLARNVFYGCMIAGALLIVFAIVSAAGKGRRAWHGLFKGYIVGAVVLLACVAGVGVCFLVDFTRAFYAFHTVFFSNDLWMLPADAVMIKMVPQPFFMDCALLLGGVFGGSMLITVLFSVIMLCVTRREKLPKPAADDFAATRRPAAVAEPATIRTKKGSDGESFFEIQKREGGERPDAEQIFERLGLDETEDPEQDEPDGIPYGTQVAPIPVAAPAAAPVAPKPVAAQEPVTVVSAQADAVNATVKVELCLDMRLVQGIKGLELVPDKSKPLDVHLTAGNKERARIEEALRRNNGELPVHIAGIALTDSGEYSQSAAPTQTLRDEPLTRREPTRAPEPAYTAAVVEPAAAASAAAPQAEPETVRKPAVEPTPSVEELLARMNEMMKNFPANDAPKDGEKK